MEINLAIFVMAVGVLAMIALYPLGFRERSQSREDVASAVLADAVLNPLAAALSQTNMTWTKWQSINTVPNGGWSAYFRSDNFNDPKTISQMSSSTLSTFQDLVGKAPAGIGVSAPSLPSAMGCALVVSRDGARLLLSFRATRRPGMLLAEPLYYTEVHFQGDPNQ